MSEYPELRGARLLDLMTNIVFSFFGFYVCQQVLERKCGFGVSIFTKDEINNMPNSTTRKRLTRGLDKHGKYRIQSKTSMYILQFTFEIVETTLVLFILFYYPNYAYDHFILMKSSTKTFPYLLHSAALMVSFYLFAVMADSYSYRLRFSALLHHWTSIFSGVSVLHLHFSPFATLYAIFGIFLTFPLDILFFIRLRYSYQYPKIMKYGFIVAFYYYLSLVLCVMIGQILLLYNAYFGYGVENANFGIHYGIFVLLGIAGLLYDDIELLKTLRQFSKMDYSNTMFDTDTIIKTIQAINMDSPTAPETPVIGAMSTITVN